MCWYLRCLGLFVVCLAFTVVAVQDYPNYCTASRQIKALSPLKPEVWTVLRKCSCKRLKKKKRRQLAEKDMAYACDVGEGSLVALGLIQRLASRSPPRLAAFSDRPDIITNPLHHCALGTDGPVKRSGYILSVAFSTFRPRNKITLSRIVRPPISPCSHGALKLYYTGVEWHSVFLFLFLFFSDGVMLAAGKKA